MSTVYKKNCKIVGDFIISLKKKNNNNVSGITTTHSPWDKNGRHCNSTCLDVKFNTICMLGFHLKLFVLGKFHFYL